MRRFLAPLAWMLIGASLVATWFLVASGSSDLDDDSELTPSSSVAVEAAVRDASAPATLVVSFPSFDVPAQVAGRLTSVASSLPNSLPASGVVWGEVDGRPRVLIGSTNAFAFFRDLARGSRGDDVVVLQQTLTDLGFYDGPLDGRFGAGVETALGDFRTSIDAASGDKALRVGDITFASMDADFEQTVLTVGTDLDPATPIGVLRQTVPLLQLRFFPRDAGLVIEGSEVTSEDFVGVVASIDVEPLAIDGTTTIRTGSVEGTLNRPVAVGEVLQVLVTVDAEPRLWLPLGSIALDSESRPYAITPQNERVVLELGTESGGFVEILGGAPEGAKVLLPNPDLFAES